jgi:hypothetical protein
MAGLRLAAAGSEPPFMVSGWAASATRLRAFVDPAAFTMAGTLRAAACRFLGGRW